MCDLMTDRSGRRLRETLAAIVQHERLDIIEVMRAGRLARNSIDGIRFGRTRLPSRATIRRLAIGTATDPRTGVLDVPKMEKYEAILNAAAGYGDLTAGQARSMIEIGLYYYLQDMPRAREVVAIVERLRGLSLDELQALSLSAAPGAALPPTDRPS